MPEKHGYCLLHIKQCNFLICNGVRSNIKRNANSGEIQYTYQCVITAWIYIVYLDATLYAALSKSLLQ